MPRPTKIGKSQYKGVSRVKTPEGLMWLSTGTVNGLQFVGKYDTEREAAINYDRKMIESGREPVNILIRK